MNHAIQTRLFEFEKELTVGQYLLAINPPTRISREVTAMKKPLMKSLGKGFALSSKPHLTLAGFPLSKKREGLLVRLLGEVSLELNALHISLNGYGSFPNSGTIYINPEPNEGLMSLYRHVAKSLRMAMRIPAKYLPKSYEPHITVVKNLNHLMDAYQALWKMYEHHEYKGQFTIDHLVLLRYHDDGSGRTEVVSEFKLGLPK